jgi:hypothetical protein
LTEIEGTPDTMTEAMDGRRMLLDSLQKSSLFTLLHQIDVDLAEETREEGCPHCDDSALHYARYRRKPRGGPDDLPDELLVRQGLCCEACRRRVLPPSVLFMGRRVYWGVVVLLVVALRQHREDAVSVRRIAQRLGVARSTIWRWMEWFRDVFPTTPAWKVRQGRLRADHDRDRPIAWLLAQFQERFDGPIDALRQLTVFVLAPDSSRFAMDA